MSRREALGGRLARLKKEGLSPPVSNREGKKSAESYGLHKLEGWKEIRPFLWKRSVVLENPLSVMYPRSLLLPGGTTCKQLLFYDTETTGLSTGAGTIPFLIGVGKVVDRGFEIIQLFLADYPGEPAMLEELQSLFRDESVYISYNGKSYDSHLINTRLLMNGFRAKPRVEVDLLYTSRRLWKNILANCRLESIESEILSIKRGPDIPGSQIPDVWFDFLKKGETEKLERVFSHNLQDIYSLALLLHQMEDIIGGGALTIPCDRFALAKLLLLWDREEGIGLLEKEWRNGNRKAGEFLSIYWKRRGEWEKALELWEDLNSRGCNFFSVEELAKYYEHKVKDYKKALTYIDRMLKGPINPQHDVKEKIIYRKKRLLEKMDRKA